MPTGERDAFEQVLATDAGLRAEVDLQRENTLAVELGGVERMLKTLGAEHADDGTKRSTPWGQYLKYAAMVAIVVSGAFWMLTRPTTNERLFAEHFTADPGLPVPMSSTNDQPFQDAMVAFKLGDLEEARDKWSSLLQAEPTNDTLRYYIASAALAMEDAAAAIPLYESISADRTSAFHQKARWYLFLAYVRSGDSAKAKAVPIDEDPTYGERARAIKAQLK
ncbi:MAG: hypothetical protein WEC15_02505 [Flavobacteriales bacterium]